MAAKFLALFVIVATVTQGLSLPRNVVQISLPDQFVTHITNPLIPRSIGIAKSFLDTLETCHVVYPNGQTFEVYPRNSLPAGPISFAYAVDPFTTCAVLFLGADVSFSGIYELMSVVHHNQENYKSLTRQRFHVTLIPHGDLWSK